MEERDVLEDIINLLLLLPEKYDANEKVQILSFYYKFNLLNEVINLIQDYLSKSVSETVIRRFSNELSYSSISVKTNLIYQIYNICPEECKNPYYNYLINYKSYLDAEIV